MLAGSRVWWSGIWKSSATWLAKGKFITWDASWSGSRGSRPIPHMVPREPFAMDHRVLTFSVNIQGMPTNSGSASGRSARDFGSTLSINACCWASGIDPLITSWADETYIVVLKMVAWRKTCWSLYAFLTTRRGVKSKQVDDQESLGLLSGYVEISKFKIEFFALNWDILWGQLIGAF